MHITSNSVPARFDLNHCNVLSQFLPGLILLPTKFDFNSCHVRSQILPGSILFLPGSFYLSGLISAPVRFDPNFCQVRSQFSIHVLHQTPISIPARFDFNSYLAPNLDLNSSHFDIKSCQLLRCHFPLGSVSFLSGSISCPTLNPTTVSIGAKSSRNSCLTPNTYLNSCHFNLNSCNYFDLKSCHNDIQFPPGSISILTRFDLNS